jgi:predicted dehydrogenase
MEATVMYSKISNSHLPMEIQGEKGTMVIEHTNTMQKAQIIYRDGSVENLTVLQHHADMRYEIETFMHLITTHQQQSAVNSWDFSKNVMRIMDEARAQIGLVYPADTCFEKDF